MKTSNVKRGNTIKISYKKKLMSMRKTKIEK